MGGCLTLDREEALAKRRSHEIDKQLQELARLEGNVVKILLLGMYVFGYILILRFGHKTDRSKN
jgi:hypothetical protein